MSSNASLYGIGASATSLASVGVVPVVETRNPTATDITGAAGTFKVGQVWINTQLNTAYTLTSLSSVGGTLTADWTSTGGAGAGVSSVQGNSGPALSGAVNIVGSGAISVAGAGSTLTISSSGGSGVSTLTGDSGGPISPVAGNIDVKGLGNLYDIVGSGNTLTVTPTLGAYPVTPYVVGPLGKAGYQTIQSAVNAANAAGGGIVVAQPGTYTENLTLFSNVHIEGMDFSDAGGGVTIVGVHTPPTSGGFCFNNVALQSATNIFSSVAAGTTHLIIANAAVTVTNGHTFNLPNWTGKLESFDVNAAIGTNDGYINNTGGSVIAIFECSLGSGNVNSMIVSGPVFGDGSNIYCPINFQTGSNVAIDYSFFGNAVTFSGNSTGTITTSHFSTGSLAAITMSSSGSWNIYTSIFDTSNDPAIAGAGVGTLKLGDVTFPNNSNISGSLTLAWADTKTGSLTVTGAQTGKIKSIVFADSPYTTASDDFYIACDTTAGVITVNLPATPAIGRHLVVADSIGMAPSNNIIVNGGANTITFGGIAALSQNITTAFSSLDLTWTGVHWEDSESAALAARFPITPYTVGPVGLAGYQTVQSAVNAANAAGGGTVYVLPQGSAYAENLTLFDKVDIVGAVASADTNVPEIFGIHTPPTSGACSFRNIALDSATDIFSSAAAGTTVIVLTDCSVACGNGFVFNLVNWTGTFVLSNVLSFTDTLDGVVNNTGGATVFFGQSILGAGSAVPMVLSGDADIIDCKIECPIQFVGSASIKAQDTYFKSNLVFSATSGGVINGGVISDSAGSALVMNSASPLSILGTTVDSISALAIDGTGVGLLTLGTLTFPNSAAIKNTLSVAWAAVAVGNTVTSGSQTGKVTVVTNGMSPYTVTANDFFVSCRTNTGLITILLPPFAASVKGRHIIVEDADGAALTNNITVNGNGDPIISGGTSGASQVINTNYGYMDLTYDGQTKWTPNADTNLAARIPLSKYVVAPGNGNAYQSIQPAIDAAVAAGVPAVIYLYPATYTEDLTLGSNITLKGTLLGNNTSPIVNIRGVHTPPLAGQVGFEDIQLIHTTGSLIVSAGVGTTNFSFTNVVGDLNGFWLDLPNWTSAPSTFVNCSTPQGGSTFDGIVNAPGMNVEILNCPTLGNQGTHTLTCLSLDAKYSNIKCPVNVRGGFPSQFVDSTFSLGVTSSIAGSLKALNCVFSNVGASTLVITSGSGFPIQCANCTFDTTFSPAISVVGPDTLRLTGAEFPNNFDLTGIAPTWGTSKTGTSYMEGAQIIGVTTNILGSPYAVLANDYFLDINTGAGAITVNLPATPETGRKLVVMDATGNAAANNITVSGNGNNLAYAGALAATFVISTAYGTVTVTFNGSAWLAV